MRAPAYSIGMPRTGRPSNFVNSTTPSNGTRQMRVTVNEFGRFMTGSSHMISSVVADEGDPAGRGQGHATPPADDSHAETDRSDLRASIPPLPAGSAEAGGG